MTLHSALGPGQATAVAPGPDLVSGHGACRGSDLGQPSHPGPRGRAAASSRFGREEQGTATGTHGPRRPPALDRSRPCRAQRPPRGAERCRCAARLKRRRLSGTEEPKPANGGLGSARADPGRAPTPLGPARPYGIALPPPPPGTHLRGATRPPLQPAGRRDRGPAGGGAAGAARRRRARGGGRAAPSRGSARGPGTCYRRGGSGGGSVPAPRRRFYGRRRRRVRHLPAPPGGGAPRGPASRSPPSSGRGPAVGSPRYRSAALGAAGGAARRGAAPRRSPRSPPARPRSGLARRRCRRGPRGDGSGAA